jgi:hypothetical protein
MEESLCAKTKKQYETIVSLKADFINSHKNGTHTEKVAAMKRLNDEINRLHSSEFEEIYGIPYRKRLAEKFHYDYVGKFSTEGLARAKRKLIWSFIKRNGVQAFPTESNVMAMPFKYGKAYLTYFAPQKPPRLFAIMVYAIDARGEKIDSEPELEAPNPFHLGYTNADIEEGLTPRINPQNKKLIDYFDSKGSLIFKAEHGM